MAPDDVQPDEAGAQAVTANEAPKSHAALAKLKRELSDEDLASPGVQKLLLDLLARSEAENRSLGTFREEFHRTDKQNGILLEKLKVSTSLEVLSTGTIAVGAILLGLLPSVKAMQLVVGGLGGVLIVAGIIAKAVRK